MSTDPQHAGLYPTAHQRNRIVDSRKCVMLGPGYVTFLEGFEKKYKALAKMLLRACRLRRPEVEWEESEFEKLVLRCGAGQGMEAVRAVEDLLPESVVAVLDVGKVIAPGRYY